MRIVSLFGIITGLGCTPDHEITIQQRQLSTEQATFDAGAVAVGERATLPIYIRSTGQGPVTILDVFTDDEEHFVVENSWMTDDWDSDGVLDAQTIAGGSQESPSYGIIEVNFRPDEEAYFRTTLTITSNDSEITEKTEDGDSVWRVVLRGLGRYPCASIYPQFHDFGPRAAGGYYPSAVTVENCGQVTVTISDFDVTGSTAFYVPDHPPIYVLPNASDNFDIAWIPASNYSDSAGVAIGINAPDFKDSIFAIGNDCTASVDTSWDEDEDGWSSCGGDCNDLNSLINPSQPEIVGNQIDDDCDNEIDEAPNSVNDDLDKDGYTEDSGDCDDANDQIHPGATEALNQIDDDCNGLIDDTTDWYDDDGDEYSEREGDCDDDNDIVFPGANDIANGNDDDCDGEVDEGSDIFDDDGDGYAEFDTDGVESDCNDDDPWTFPGAQEDCDGRDNNCDGIIDENDEGTENGACSYIVERNPEVITPPQTCATTSSPNGQVLLVLLVIGFAVARQRTNHHGDGCNAFTASERLERKAATS